MKKARKKQPSPPLAETWDFSEGFGGIPENVSLTQNIGCASNSGNKGKKTSKKSSSDAL
jgi:hypothetical protein